MMTVKTVGCKKCGQDFEQELKQGKPYSKCERCRLPPRPRRPRLLDVNPADHPADFDGPVEVIVDEAADHT